MSAGGTVAWQDAVQASGDGVRLLLAVHPGASAAQFPAGFDSWRGRIVMRVTAAARGGAANAEVVEAAATCFGVAQSRVEIVAGVRGRRKSIAVGGIGRDEALQRLAPAMDSQDTRR